jgi:hypothetical protein
MVIRKFKFALRYIYAELLVDIVATAKEDLYFLLEPIPEILPFVPHFEKNESEDPSIFEGVWGDVKVKDWEQSLYLGTLLTVYNQEMVLEASKAVCMKRNWLTSHDMIFLTVLSLSLIEHIFTHFSYQERVSKINFVQSKYS